MSCISLYYSKEFVMLKLLKLVFVFIVRAVIIAAAVAAAVGTIVELSLGEGVGYLVAIALFAVMLIAPAVEAVVRSTQLIKAGNRFDAAVEMFMAAQGEYAERKALAEVRAAWKAVHGVLWEIEKWYGCSAAAKRMTADVQSRVFACERAHENSRHGNNW